MARWLSRRAPHYDALLTSPARRARLTVAALCEALELPAASPIVVDALYTFDGDELIEAVRRLDPSWQSVLLVGHNPAITEALNLLCDCDVDNVPTCGIAEIRIATGSWRALRPGCGELRAYETPKQLKKRSEG
jgi:phosphohistidine phosphatase